MGKLPELVKAGAKRTRKEWKAIAKDDSTAAVAEWNAQIDGWAHKYGIEDRAGLADVINEVSGIIESANHTLFPFEDRKSRKKQKPKTPPTEAEDHLDEITKHLNAIEQHAWPMLKLLHDEINFVRLASSLDSNPDLGVARLNQFLRNLDAARLELDAMRTAARNAHMQRGQGAPTKNAVLRAVVTGLARYWAGLPDEKLAGFTNGQAKSLSARFVVDVISVLMPSAIPARIGSVLRDVITSMRRKETHKN